MKILCKCGCGNLTSGKLDHGKYPEFIYGHMKGEFNPARRPEVREKLRILSTGELSNAKKLSARIINSQKNKGKHHSPKTEFKRQPETSVKEYLRSCYLYNKWRKAVFEWDSYTCRICGQKGKLNADHYPFSFSHLMQVYNIKTIEEGIDCRLLWDIGNGRTLCIECHKKTPNYLKRYENTI